MPLFCLSERVRYRRGLVLVGFGFAIRAGLVVRADAQMEGGKLPSFRVFGNSKREFGIRGILLADLAHFLRVMVICAQFSYGMQVERLYKSTEEWRTKGK